MDKKADGPQWPRRWAGLFAVGLVLALMGGCKEISDINFPELGDISGHQPDLADMTGTNWRAVNIAGYGRTGAAESSISFNQDDQLSGKTGCNTFLGPYRMNGDQITFGPFAMTRMMCELEVASQEEAFLNALATSATIEVSGDAMSLSDGSGNVIMSLVLIE